MATYLQYLDAALKRANYEKMDDGRYFASIAGFDGLWVVSATLDEARRELYTALDGWIDVHIKIGQERPPVIDDVDLFGLPKLA
jgi:predicted RNase H-like HicB family nuclease